MSTQVGELRVDGIGSRGAEVRYEVTAEAIRNYAAATEEPPA